MNLIQISYNNSTTVHTKTSPTLNHGNWIISYSSFKKIVRFRYLFKFSARYCNWNFATLCRLGAGLISM